MTSAENTARAGFCAAALAAAIKHNVLTADQRAELEAHVAAGAFGDEEGYLLGDEVLWVLSNRCRSFTPPVLENLSRLHGAVWDLI